MIQQIKDNLWQLSFKEFGSCVYVINLKDKKIIIDTSSLINRKELSQDLRELKINPSKIDIVILTHNHYDHMENIGLFPNTKIYGSKEDFKEKNITNINELNIKEFKIIKTPGHTKGGICILYKGILFSGDTIFGGGYVGRTDLPGGSYQELKKSIEKLKKAKYEILCPGHLG
jgi:glyoxylase-like metal-dependent hydrolase (beta-lactamase superfamily II)